MRYDAAAAAAAAESTPLSPPLVFEELSFSRLDVVVVVLPTLYQEEVPKPMIVPTRTTGC